MAVNNFNQTTRVGKFLSTTSEIEHKLGEKFAYDVHRIEEGGSEVHTILMIQHRSLSVYSQTC